MKNVYVLFSDGTWYYMYKHSIPFTYDMEDLEYYCFAKINSIN